MRRQEPTPLGWILAPPPWLSCHGRHQPNRNAERRLAAHRKSLHGKLAHDIVSAGITICIEKTSFKGWQKQYGKVRSVSSKSRRSRDDELVKTRQLVA